MKTTRDALKRAAEIARLHLSEKQLHGLLRDAEDILKLFERIDKVSVKNVSPTFHPIPVENIYREDIPRRCLSAEEVFKNAPHKKGRYFKGPKII